jgi:hypothetical protein
MRGMPGSSVRGGDVRSTSSASNPYEDRSSTVSSPNTVVGHPIAFSGWDNTGKQHQQVRLPSGTTSATPPSAPPTATATSVPAEHSTVRGKGNWARPVSKIFIIPFDLRNRSDLFEKLGYLRTWLTVCNRPVTRASAMERFTYHRRKPTQPIVADPQAMIATEVMTTHEPANAF